MTLIRVCVIALCILYSPVLGGESVRVATYLYGSAQLPCDFPFVTGSQDVVVTWLKVADIAGGAEHLVVHSYRDGRDLSEYQNPLYKGRTHRPKGTLDLILTNVTTDDEGTYICQAANQKSRGSKEILLSIDRLNAEDPTVTVVSIDGEKRLKCVSSGVYRDPRVEWHDREMTDLSTYGSLTVTDAGDGRKVVESVLSFPYEPNHHYFCHVKEGGLKRSARAVESDKAVDVDDEL